MVEFTDRRQFLQLAGTGTALSLAGCGGSQPDDSGESTAELTNSETPAQTTGTPEDATVTVVVQPDQQALQQRRSEIQSQLEGGNVSQREAQQQYRSAQAELTREAANTFTQRVSEMDALTIDESITRFGAFLVSGAPAALIEVLSLQVVQGLFAESVFSDIQSRASEQTQTQTAG